MDRLLRILFALLVVIGATGAELRLPESRPDMDCPVSADGTCPCGMPMPTPQSCGHSLPSPGVAPTRAVSVLIECAASADRAMQEPRPWPAAWSLPPRLQNARYATLEVIPVDTGPPLPASERAARLRVFLI